MIKILSVFIILISFVSPSLADTISGMRDPDRDYALEGTVVTVWEDSFLLSDGTGEVVVNMHPHNSFFLGLAGQQYVMVTGRIINGRLKPVVISRQGFDPILFSGPTTLPDLPIDKVLLNTARHRLPNSPGSETARTRSQPVAVPKELPSPVKAATAAANTTSEMAKAVQPTPPSLSESAKAANAPESVPTGLPQIKIPTLEDATKSR